MEKQMTLREWQNAYKAGEFGSDIDSQCAAGWYDWFCNDRSLATRLKKLAPVVLGITNDYILDNFYVWFKNNCPVSGPLYDDIRFEPLKEELRESHYFIVVYKDKREETLWSLYTPHDIFKDFSSTPTGKFNNVREVVKFINNMKF